ncbi:FtsK/SpoIIIE domain-containing protein [Halobacillus sp. MO56]
MVTPQQLTGQWVQTILQEYFKEQSRNNSEKLFLKINGLTEKNIEAVLDYLNDNFNELSNYYTPIIRTITPVEGFSQYSYKEHETSIWLRNNTKSGEALLLIINNVTSEAQSLENLFSLDESVLLSDEGIKSLFFLIQMEYKIASEEIKILETFLEMYKKVSEPQLQSLTNFVSAILNDKQVSMINKVQSNLPHLNCFKDSNLQVDKKHIKRLKSNYFLSHLQKNEGSSIDLEKLQEKFYTFLDYEEKKNWPHEIWNEINVNDLRQEVFEFISSESDNLLHHEYEVINQIFAFKPVKQSLGEKVRNQFDDEDLSKEDKERIERASQVVDYENDPDFVEGFIDDYQEILESDGKLLKSLKRYVEKQRHSSEYNDILDGLFYEIYTLIEDNSEAFEASEENLNFLVRVNSKQVDENSSSLINFYLKNINNKIPFLKFDEESNKVGNEKNVENISFRVCLNKGSQQIDSNLFTVNDLNKSSALQFFDLISEYKVPHIKQFLEEDMVVEDLVQVIEKEVSPTLNQFDTKTVNAYEKFLRFLSDYSSIMSTMIAGGIYDIDDSILESSLEDLLSNIYESVSNVQNLFSYINTIGVLDYYEEKPSQFIHPVERLVTVFNPVRLLSYIHKTKQMGNDINVWMEQASKGELNVKQREEFLEFSTEKYHKLAPRYFNRGDNSHYFIEVFEEMGNGLFSLDNKRSTYSANDTKEISNELVNVTKNYLEVFPYAKDGLDVLFLHVDHSDIITESIKNLFKSKLGINKLKITAHSTNSAILHDEINSWIEHNEEFVLPTYENKFPKVEVNVINGDSISKIEKELNYHMVDADLVILADYFSKSGQIEFEFNRKQINLEDNWFNKPTVEPLKEMEAIKRLPLESEHLPKVLIDFYQMQYIAHTNAIPEEDDLYILSQTISANKFNEGSLIDYMHENYNWNMIMDRFLDRSLLQKASGKAQIIHYKSKAGTSKQFKLLVSSSRNIKRLNTAKSETEYYGRLERKLKQLLRVKQISAHGEVQQTVDEVKEISGSLVLKALGPGKFSHELMATYIFLKDNLYAESSADEQKLQIVSTCDELPWFSRNRGSNKRRPDLVVTNIYKNNDKINVDFNLVELKFIRESLVDREKIDAIKQVKAGMSLYKDLFSFEETNADSEFWKEEFINYLIENKDYMQFEVDLIKDLQRANMGDIQTVITSQINIYSYDSFLENYDGKMSDDGVFTDQVEEDVTLNIFNRKYILDKYGVPDLLEEANYGELKNKEHEDEDSDQDVKNDGDKGYSNNSNGKSGNTLDEKVDREDEEKEKYEESGQKSNEEVEDVIEVKGDRSQLDVIAAEDKGYPEEEALKNIILDRNNQDEDLDELVNEYQRILVRNLNKNSIPAKIKDTVIGSSVIRIYLEIPANLAPATIQKKAQSLQLWLRLDTEPTVGVHRQGLYIDINRVTPSIVYFDQFMKKVRGTLNNNIEKNLVVPIGIDPLNNVLKIDMADSMTPHLLVGGTTGSGKSVTLNSIIIGLMLLYPKEHVTFTFIDPKKVEFAKYENIPYTNEVIYELDQSVIRLEELCTEMDERYSLMQKEYMSDIKDYNEQVNEDNRMAHKVIVFDEFADFQSQDKQMAKRVEESIKRLGQKGRAAGMHLIICTQNPKAEVINTTIRSNLPARLALKVTDGSSSKIILDETGAEKLAGKGDFLLKGSSGASIRGKSPFLEPKVQGAIFKYLAKS